MCTLSTENSDFCPWHAAQLSPRMVVFAKACEAVALSSWQPWQAAEMGGVVGVKPPGLAIDVVVGTTSTW